MGWNERLFIWLGGYSARTVESDHTEDREPITKIGAAILFAATVAMLNWGLAGWAYSEGNSSEVRFLVAALAGTLGGAIVLVFDRGFVYLADTASGPRKLQTFTYGVFRIVVIVAVGSITAQAVMPLLLASELKSHALSMVEGGEKRRSADLSNQFKVEEKESAQKSAQSNLDRAQTASLTVPSDIQRRLALAKSCWVEYAAKKRTLIQSGVEPEVARLSLRNNATTCSQQNTKAISERDDYLRRARSELELAKEQTRSTTSDLSEATTTVKNRLERAHTVEEEAFNPRSSTVLWSLLINSPGAFAKWAIVSFVVLIFELLPLIQKFQAGQSTVGKRVASSQRMRSLDSETRLMQHEHDYEVSLAVNAASKQGTEDALRNPAVRAVFAQTFAANMSAFAPTEAVRTMMREIESRHVSVEDFMHRFPRYAAIISQAWSNAVRQTADILKNGLYGSTK